MELENRSKKLRKAKVNKNVKEHYKRMDKVDLQKLQNESKAASRKRMREEDYEDVNDKEIAYLKKCRTKKRNEDIGAYKERDRMYQAKHRRIGTSSMNRLNRFREDIMYGPLFICICCHGKMFRHSVQEFTDQLMRHLDQKIHLTNVIADMNVVTRVITEYPRNPWSIANKKKIDEG